MACIATAGTLSSMIPPSIVMVLYAIISGASVGRCLIAGLIPGIIGALSYFITLYVVLRLKPNWAGKEPPAEAPLIKRILALKDGVI